MSYYYYRHLWERLTTEEVLEIRQWEGVGQLLDPDYTSFKNEFAKRYDANGTLAEADRMVKYQYSW